MRLYCTQNAHCIQNSSYDSIAQERTPKTIALLHFVLCFIALHRNHLLFSHDLNIIIKLFSKYSGIDKKNDHASLLTDRY